jgi:hypothetical protein
MPTWLLVALMALTTWRATRFVTEDDFPPVRWARDRILGHGPEWLGELVTCPWCASVWLAAGVVAATDALVPVPRPLLAFGAVAALSPILSVLVGRLDRPEPPGLLPLIEVDEAGMATLQMQVGDNGKAEV